MGGRRLRGIGALSVLSALALFALPAPPAQAQTRDEIAAARKTFAQAIEDQTAKRYEAALEEFNKVAQVKETANVRYRIASCLDALGRGADALASYEQAVREGEEERGAAAVVRASRVRAAELDRTVPRLTITFPKPPPEGAELRLDDAPVDLARLRDPIAVDAGHHLIEASAPGATPFHTGVTLPEGGRVSITVELTPIAPITVQAPSLTVRPSGSEPRAPREEPAQAAGQPIAGYVLFGVGGLLAAGSVVSFVLRGMNIGTLHSDCMAAPMGDVLVCPPSSADEVRSAQSAAKIEGPLGIGLAIGAGVAVAAGVWLVLAPPSHGDGHATAGLRLAPILLPHGGALSLAGAL